MTLVEVLIYCFLLLFIMATVGDTVVLCYQSYVHADDQTVSYRLGAALIDRLNIEMSTCMEVYAPLPFSYDCTTSTAKPDAPFVFAFTQSDGTSKFVGYVFDKQQMVIEEMTYSSGAATVLSSARVAENVKTFAINSLDRGFGGSPYFQADLTIYASNPTLTYRFLTESCPLRLGVKAFTGFSQ
jgi:hypothetical protein